MPKSVLHDQDSRFTSSFWCKLQKLMGSKVIFSSAFHPTMDGQTERANETVMQCIKVVLKEQKGDWVSALPAVELAINFTVNDSTGFPLFFIAYGQEAMKPTDLMEGFNQNPAAEGFAHRIIELYDAIKTRLLKAQAA